MRKSALFIMTNKTQIREPEGKSCTPDDLKSCLGFFKVREMTTGLNTDKIALKMPSIEEISAEIGKLDFGGFTQIWNLWDCSERAIWCVMHIRHMFPGIAIGMVEGKATVGTIKDEDHAVMVVWDKNLAPTYIDPQQIGKSVTFSEIVRITAFPIAPDGQADTAEPFKTLKLPRLKNGQIVCWDTQYWIYSAETILDYLKKAEYENQCASYFSHFIIKGEKNSWKSGDQAFWAYTHVRRAFPGCAFGVAFGTPKKPNDPEVVNLLFTENGGKIEPIYWSPARMSRNRKQVDFKPTRVFI